MRSGYKHYRNSQEPGRTTFFTSTVLDFVKVFADASTADLMAASLLSDIQFYGAELWAFVVMGHHIHLLATPAENMTASGLMQRIKGNAARRLLPRLSEGHVLQLGSQRGLNKRSLWKVSFRSIPIINRKMLDQKIRYIHLNPVRARLCDRPEDYRWSSCWMYGGGRYDWERGLSVDDDLIGVFCDPAALRIGGGIRAGVVEPSVGRGTLNPARVEG